jgi:hypothetical protein
MLRFGLLATATRTIRKPVETLNNWLFRIELRTANRYMVAKGLWQSDGDHVDSDTKPSEDAKTFTIMKAIKKGRRYSRTKGGWYFEGEDDHG